MRRGQRIAVIVPALDEEASLPGVLADLPAWVDRVIVVDNGSRDATAEVAVREGAELVRAPRRGYGTAVQAGLLRLADAPPDIVLVLDADHADHPELAHRLVDPVVDGVADLVMIDRTLHAEPAALTFPQRFGNALAVRLIGATVGVRTHDMGPFRAIRYDRLVALAMEDPTWGWNVEMQMKAVHHGLRILEVPLPYRRRTKGRSKISGSLVGAARAGVRILAAVRRYRHP